MSSQNYFDLLVDDENEEPTAVITRATLPSAVEKPVAKKLPTTASMASSGRLTKPTSPSDAVKEPRATESSRGGGGGGRGPRVAGRSSHDDRDREIGYQREGRDLHPRERAGYSNDRTSIANREIGNDVSQVNRGAGHGGSGDGANASGNALHGVGFGGERAYRGEGENWTHEGNRGRGGRGAGRGRDRLLASDSDDRLRRREFDRRSRSGFGNDIKRDGSGRGNWGSEGDQAPLQDAQDLSLKEEHGKSTTDGEEKTEGDGDTAGDVEGDIAKKEELTLDEYEKILEAKRKVLLSSKAEERKVQADKAFASMQLVDKKSDDSIFIKLGSDKEKKKEKEKEALENEEKAKKTQSINEFLKPADGEKCYGSGNSRGRGRGRENRGTETRGMDSERVSGSGSRGGFVGDLLSARRVSAPRIEDPGQFPDLGAK